MNNPYLFILKVQVCPCHKNQLIFMYLVNFALLKNYELTNDHLEIENLERNSDLGATI